MKTNSPAIIDAFAEHAKELPPTTKLTVVVCELEELTCTAGDDPEVNHVLAQALRNELANAQGCCLAEEHRIWLRPKPDRVLVWNFWHELGHYFDCHRHDWLTRFIAGSDDGFDWRAALGEDYTADQIPEERRAWLFALKFQLKPPI